MGTAERERLKKGFQNYERFVGQFVKAGDKVMTGDDTSSVGWATAGVGIHHEMELMVESGLTPMQAIMAATRNPAEGYRVLNRIGTIEPGKFADMVVVNADPLQDIRNTQQIEWVVKDGKVLDRAYHRWFVDPFNGDDLEAPDWLEGLKRATAEGVRTVAGLTDPTWAFGQPCPGIESLSPLIVTEDGQQFTLTIKGINFTKKSTVYWGRFRNQLLVASPYLTKEKALMPDLEWTRTVEAKKLFLNIANQKLAGISPTIYYGRTPTIHCIPGYVFDSGNGRFVHLFHTETGDLVKGFAAVMESMINSPAVPVERLFATFTSKSATPSPPGPVGAITNDRFERRICSRRTLLVWASEVLHCIWTRSTTDLMTSRLCLNSCKVNELRMDHQQSIAEAPATFRCLHQ